MAASSTVGAPPERKVWRAASSLSRWTTACGGSPRTRAKWRCRVRGETPAALAIGARPDAAAGFRASACLAASIARLTQADAPRPLPPACLCWPAAERVIAGWRPLIESNHRRDDDDASRTK